MNNVSLIILANTHVSQKTTVLKLCNESCVIGLICPLHKTGNENTRNSKYFIVHFVLTKMHYFIF